ncbi:MAG: LPXTG cell wall anchor domain-containing protein, partial [Acidimicrobiia bacterium]|nr:LPXTG cell wall anchor domain-containing protein [Acidimicrobiia bacterium]
GETWTYQATNTASAGQYGNTADVTGTPPVGSPVTDDDPSHYLGVTAALSGRIWLDEDRDGIEQPGDAGVEFITVTLYAASDLTTPVATTTSAPDGTYVFTDLPAGDYVVGIDIPGDMMSSPANVGGDDSVDSDLDPGTHLTASVSLPAGGLVADVDAGVYPVPVSVGDLIWFDVDGNGLNDGVDMPLAGVSVELVSGGVVLDTRVTAADGTFLWTDLAPGAYEVRVVSDSLPAGIELNTYDTDGILDGAYSEDVPPGGHLASEFAYAGVGLIGDTVWYDADGDGTQNMMSNGTMEPGLESIVLSAVWVGFDGVAGTADDIDFGARVSNEDGKYLFSQLPFGDFIVDVGDANGYLHAGETTLTVTVDAAVLGNALTADFRFVLPEPELPRTGAETRDLTLVALALIGLGLLFVGVGRRREDEPEPA